MNFFIPALCLLDKNIRIDKKTPLIAICFTGFDYEGKCKEFFSLFYQNVRLSHARNKIKDLFN